jgi:hypothetical protein
MGHEQRKNHLQKIYNGTSEPVIAERNSSMSVDHVGYWIIVNFVVVTAGVLFPFGKTAKISLSRKIWEWLKERSKKPLTTEVFSVLFVISVVKSFGKPTHYPLPKIYSYHSWRIMFFRDSGWESYGHRRKQPLRIYD